MAVRQPDQQYYANSYDPSSSMKCPNPPTSLPTPPGSAIKQIVYYVSDPNSEGVKPDDISSPAKAVTQDGAGAEYVWNDSTQSWN